MVARENWRNPAYALDGKEKRAIGIERRWICRVRRKTGNILPGRAKRDISQTYDGDNNEEVGPELKRAPKGRNFRLRW